jgi:hypothetical protein
MIIRTKRARLPTLLILLKISVITLTLDDDAEASNCQKSWNQPVLHLALKNLHRIFCLSHGVQQLPGNRENREIFEKTEKVCSHLGKANKPAKISIVRK